MTPDPLEPALAPLRLAYSWGLAGEPLMGTPYAVRHQTGDNPDTMILSASKQVEAAYRLGQIHRSWGMA